MGSTTEQRSRKPATDPASRTLADDSKTLADSPSPDLQPQRAPVSVPDHELLACIGRGSYGEVWLARNVMGTFRAVKIVYRAAFEHARPFEREFKGIQKFEPISRSHDGFVDVLQIGRTPDYFYYVMELADDVVTGQQIDPATYEPKTLRSQVQAHKPLPFEQCVELGLSLTAALSHLHGHGLIHRDIKPSNIIFVNGIAKLADIGLVAEQSEAKSFVGTEGFIPPEGPGTPQADIYSLGKVLYEMATGKDRHEFPALPTLLGDAATGTHLLELNTVSLKACQADLKRRYQTAAQMREDLLLLRIGKSVKRAQIVEHRFRVMLQVSMIGFVLTTLIAGGFQWARRQAEQEARWRKQAEADRDRAQILSYDSDLSLAWTAAKENNLAQMLALLKAQIPGPGVRDRRGWEWRYLWPRALGDQIFTLDHTNGEVIGLVSLPGNRLVTGVMTSPGGIRIWDLARREVVRQSTNLLNISDLAVSRDGRQLAAANWTSTIYLLDPDSLATVRQLQESNHVIKVEFSPDGRLLSAKGQEQVSLWNLETGERLWAVPSLGGSSDAPFSPDGQWLACAGAQGALQRRRLRDGSVIDEFPLYATGQTAISPDGAWLTSSRFLSRGDLGLVNLQTREVTPLRGHTAGVRAIAFTPDNRRLATAGNDGMVKIWDLASRTEVASMLGHRKMISSMVISKDGRLLYTGAKDGTVRAWSADLGKKENTGAPASSNGQDLVLSHNGRFFAALGSNATAVITELSPARELARLNLPGNGTSRALSDDGRRFAVGCADGNVHLWDLEKGPTPETFQAQTGSVESLEFTPDSRLLATVARGFEVRVWNLQSKQLLLSRHYDVPSNWIYDLVFAPDSRLLALSPTLSEVELVDLTGKLPDRHFHGDGRRGLAFSPDGLLLAICDDDRITVRELASLSLVKTLGNGQGSYAGVGFSPKGDRIIATDEQGVMFLWDLESERELARFDRGHVRLARFQPDGNTLVLLTRAGCETLYAPPLEQLNISKLD